MNTLSLLHDMALFVEVARTGSFSRASESLSVPGSTLSRRIAAMERDFGVRLIDRTTRKVALTEQGKRYLERCAHLVDEARMAQDALHNEVNLPSGNLRVSMPVDLGVYVIGPLLPDFTKRFPAITLDIDLSARNTDLIDDGVDVAVRIGPIKEEMLVARPLGQVKMALFASPAYLELKGHPKQPSELERYDCLVIRGQADVSTWRLQNAQGQSTQVQLQGKLKSNNLGLLRQLAEGGLGIAHLAQILAKDAVSQGRLAQVLPGWELPSLPIHALSTSRLQSAGSRAFVDFLSQRLPFVLG